MSMPNGTRDNEPSMFAKRLGLLPGERVRLDGSVVRPEGMPEGVRKLYDELDATTDTRERMRIIDALAAREA